jgi:tRNA 5-methylaminomethyl-2-thiouridine biosynthesis bifunctional protein
LCSAPILGEILACQLLQEPMPLAQSLLEQLNPNRYWIKQLKKHNVNI